MKKGLTIISRGAVFLMGAAVLSVCGILFPEIAREDAMAHPDNPLPLPFLIWPWVLAIPIFVALYQTLKLLSYIDNKNAFSQRSIKALQIIKICAITFGVLIVASVIVVFAITRVIDPQEDAAPVGTFGFIFTFVSIVIAAFVAVLQRVLKNGIDIKSENDLTV